jgi:hypothetical protein
LWHSIVRLKAKCHRSKTSLQSLAFHCQFESGNAGCVSFRGSSFENGLWHSAASMTSECHRPKKAGMWHSAQIWVRNVANDWIPASITLHHASPCLQHCNLLMCYIQSVKYFLGGLFRLNIQQWSQLTHDSHDTIPFYFNGIKLKSKMLPC